MICVHRNAANDTLVAFKFANGWKVHLLPHADGTCGLVVFADGRPDMPPKTVAGGTLTADQAALILADWSAQPALATEELSDAA